ncbi:MAG: hypothetical protein ABEI58_00060 [Candidatus Nanohaloarchaea archaeon]
MVVKEEYEGQDSFKCEAKHQVPGASKSTLSMGKDAECGFHYEDRRMAEKCEAKQLPVASSSIFQWKMRKHCRDYASCDTEIVMNSLERS